MLDLIKSSVTAEGARGCGHTGLRVAGRLKRVIVDYSTLD